MPENAFRIPLKTDRQWQSDRHNIWAEILQYRHKQETLEQQTEREQLNAKRREQREFLRRQVELKQAKQRAAKMAVRREFVALVLEPSAGAQRLTLLHVPVWLLCKTMSRSLSKNRRLQLRSAAHRAKSSWRKWCDSVMHTWPTSSECEPDS